MGGEGGAQQWRPSKVVRGLRVGLEQGCVTWRPLKGGRGCGKAVSRHSSRVGGQVEAELSWRAPDWDSLDLREGEALLWSGLIKTINFVMRAN